MKVLSIRLLSCLSVALCMLSAEGRSTHEPREIIKYVKGGACEPGDGTKEHPFTSLAQAQEQEVTWNVLKVLSSPVPLVGPFILSDGKTLLGEEDPTGTFVSPTQPTITNPGDVAIRVVGNATIKNIRIKTASGAIIYDEAEDLHIENVLIEDYRAIGIAAATTKSGKTVLNHVIIRDGIDTTAPIGEDVSGGAKRQLSICNTEIFGFNRSAIQVTATGTSTISHVEIKKSSVHNAGLKTTDPICNFTAQQGAQQSAHVISTNFYDVTSTMILGQAASGGSGKLHVDRCTFSGVGTNDAVAVVSSDASSKACIENCLAESVKNFATTGNFDTIESAVASAQSIHVSNNEVHAKVFYAALNASLSATGGVTRAHIAGNNFVGTAALDSFAIFVSFTGIAFGWELLDIQAKDNCFTLGAAAFKTESNTSLSGHAVISAHHNSIVGFSSDIDDNVANITYKVCKNWWGQGADCDPGDCDEFQVCKNHVCFGPKNVHVSDPSLVDATNPLDAPIKCPRGCCPGQPVPII